MVIYDIIILFAIWCRIRPPIYSRVHVFHCWRPRHLIQPLGLEMAIVQRLSGNPSMLSRHFVCLSTDSWIVQYRHILAIRDNYPPLDRYLSRHTCTWLLPAVVKWCLGTKRATWYLHTLYNMVCVTDIIVLRDFLWVGQGGDTHASKVRLLILDQWPELVSGYSL